VAAEADGLDVLVNSAWGGYERMLENGAFTFALPFWEQPPHRWVAMMDAGLRAAFAAASHAARLMLSNRRGLIVNISSYAAPKHIFNVIYGVSKAATDKMTSDMAIELRPYGVAWCRSILALYGQRPLSPLPKVAAWICRTARVRNSVGEWSPPLHGTLR
jgi:NAD(P)-dependent dehydrogenase (short-subunit alcohol dehydrogenase family)